MSIAEHTLGRASNERLQRGIEGLIAGGYAITMTRQNDDEVSAFISNGDGVSYSTTLTATRSFCSCKDAMFRSRTCKHSVALALFAIRNPPLPQGAPDLSLAKMRRHEETAPF
jgi:uncharacterized Zn finger protein